MQKNGKAVGSKIARKLLPGSKTILFQPLPPQPGRPQNGSGWV
jgi:hypothetical protein